MGVRGLQTFMEKCVTDGACQVNIKDIIQTYKRESGRDRVVIAVDGCSCMRPFYGGLDWVCGGQIKEFVEKFKAFIQAFTDLGVELVFFFDGPTQARKRRVWCDRRCRSLNDAQEVFRILARGVSPSHVPHNLLQLPPATSYLASYAIETSPGCKLKRTIRECDEEMVEYAVQNHCFALLGQDSDYIIYDGPQYYLSAVHLNVPRMTTVNYNRWALARQLKIDADMLPLFASLVGNDIIPFDDLVNFHQRIMRIKGRNARPNMKDVMYSVAHFIRNNASRGDVYRSLPSVSRTVFGSESQASLLHVSVRSYTVNRQPVSEPDTVQLKPTATDPVEKWKQIQKFAEKRFTNGNLDCMIYAIMHGLPYESSTGLEDFSKTAIPPSALAFRSLRQCIYGIVLHEKPREEGKEVIAEEWCMRGPDSLKEADQVRVIFPEPESHPGLLVLWDEEGTCSEEVLSQKWHLVATAVSPKLSSERLRNVPASLLPPTLMLAHLCHVATPLFLETWEVDAFIATAVTLPLHDATSLSRIMIKTVNPRAVQLACVFLRGASIIKMLMDAVGHPIPKDKVSAWYFFDGKLFQTMYLKAQTGQKAIDLCKHHVAQLEEFNLLRSIILPEDN